LPVFKRSQFLELLLAGRRVVAISGSAGKTTTTGWAAFLLQQVGLQPGFILGGEPLDLSTNGAAGAENAPMVIEADEYDHMFLGLRPQVAVVTNIEWDHPDLYPTSETYFQVFMEFTKRIQPGGLLLTCADDPGASRLPTPPQVWRETYGLG